VPIDMATMLCLVDELDETKLRIHSTFDQCLLIRRKSVHTI
jgi:hypothetical protein